MRAALVRGDFPAPVRVIAIILAGTMLAGCAKAPIPRSHSVSIRAFRYLPETLTVAVGDTVNWANEDLVPHTVTAKSSQGFDSRDMAIQGRWQYVTREPATVDYVCDYHPSMKGVLVIR